MASLPYEMFRLVSEAYSDIRDVVALSFFRQALRSDIRSKIELTVDESDSLEKRLKCAKQFQQLFSLDQPPAVVNAVSLEPDVTSTTNFYPSRSLGVYLEACVHQPY